MGTAIGVLGVILLPVSLVFFVLGLAKPDIFNKLFRGKANKAKNTLLSVLVLIVAITFISIAGYGSPVLAEAKTPTNQKSLTLDGTNAYKNSDIKIYNNGDMVKELKADDNGKFTADIELKEGENKLKASSTNNKGKTQTSSEKVIVLDLTPPSLEIDQPKSQTDSDKFTLTGKNEKNAEVIVYSGDKEIKKTKTTKETFEIKDITLSEGENKFSVKAVDAADNYSLPKEFSVTYQKPQQTSQQSETKQESQQTASTEPPKQESIYDKLWKALDESRKTRDGYSIEWDDQYKVVTLTRGPRDYYDETDTVRAAYTNLVSYGFKAFDIDGVDKVEVILKASFTDQYGKNQEEKAVDLRMNEQEFRKYDWNNLKYVNIYNQMLNSCDIYYVHPAIYKAQHTDKLYLVL